MDILSDIIMGKFDDRLPEIIEAAKGRQKTVATRSIVVGDTVVFNSQARPKYLQGIKAEVVGKTNTKLKISLERGVERFPAGIPITTPYEIVTKVEE